MDEDLRTTRHKIVDQIRVVSRREDQSFLPTHLAVHVVGTDALEILFRHPFLQREERKSPVARDDNRQAELLEYCGELLQLEMLDVAIVLVRRVHRAPGSRDDEIAAHRHVFRQPRQDLPVVSRVFDDF